MTGRRCGYRGVLRNKSQKLPVIATVMVLVAAVLGIYSRVTVHTKAQYAYKKYTSSVETSLHLNPLAMIRIIIYY